MSGGGRPRTAVLIGAAWPDNDASGPVQSVRAICTALADDAHFDLFARAGPPGGVPLVTPGTRHDAPWGTIRYLDIGRMGARGLAAAVREARPDRLWLNSVWDREFSLPALVHRRLRSIPAVRTLLSTRGEFAPGALALHARRKTAMLALVQRAGLLSGVTLHATGEQEAADVRRAFPGHPLLIADNVRLLEPPLAFDAGGEDALRVAFLGRISPVKGLHHALAALAQVRARVRFTIWGPVHDAEYWAMCQARIAELSDTVGVVLAGPIANADAGAALAGQDLFLNPSASENFGHTIVESLMAGTPVLTGTATPWNGLAEDRAGMNIRSDDVAAIARAIDDFARLPATVRAEWRVAARRRAERFASTQDAIDRWRDWFAEPRAGGFA